MMGILGFSCILTCYLFIGACLEGDAVPVHLLVIVNTCFCKVRKNYILAL